MSIEIWQLFPFPTLSADEGVTSGSIVEAPAECLRCLDRPCIAQVRQKSDDPQICKYGFTVAAIDSERNVVGLVSRDHLSQTGKARKRLRTSPERAVTFKSLRSAIATARSLGPGVVRDVERAKEELFDRLRDDPRFWDSVATDLRRDFERNLDQSHDFLQLVKQVKGHAETLLRLAHPDLDLESAAEQLPTEGAIYFASTLMILKIDSLRYLREVNLAVGKETRFRIHPFVLKYVRIYKWQADQRELDLRLVGQSHGSSRYNNDAIGVVLQGLLDNMIKYAPAGSTATIAFDENEHEIGVSFASLGPKIEPAEVSQIFLPGYRAEAARRVDAAGLGVGLATARNICDALGMSLTVKQDSDSNPEYRDRFLTTFSFTLARSD